MARRRRNQERADQFIRLGLQLWANQERQEAYKEEKEEVRTERERVQTEEKRRFGLQEKRRETQEERQVELGERQEEEFEWKKQKFGREEKAYEEKREFEVVKKEFDVVEALGRTGNNKDAAARLSNLINTRWPDGDEIRIVFPEDIKDPKLQLRLKGKEIVVFSKESGLLPFKTMKDVMRFAAAKLNYGEYLKDLRASEAKVAEANRRAPVIIDKDGNAIVDTYFLGPGGNIRLGKPKPYTGAIAAPKRTGLSLKAKEAEEVLDRPLTSKEKKVTLGLAEKEKKGKAPDISKQLKADKAALDLLLRRFVSKSNKKDALSELLGEGEDVEVSLTETGKNAIDTALTIAEKADAGEPLTPKEKKLLPAARRVQKVYSQISGRIAKEYAGEESLSSPGTDSSLPRHKAPTPDGMSWSAYQ